MAKEAPRWRANATSYIGFALVNEGEEVSYTPAEGSGVGANLSPLNEAAQAIVDSQPDAGKPPHPDKTPADDKPAKGRARGKPHADEGQGEGGDGDVA